jgi:hypothetical protein
MPKPAKARNPALGLLGPAMLAAFCLAPIGLQIDGHGAHLAPAAAFAKDGGSGHGSGSGGGGSGSGGGSGHSGDGHGGHGSGGSGSGGSGSTGSNSGPGSSHSGRDGSHEGAENGDDRGLDGAGHDAFDDHGRHGKRRRHDVKVAFGDNRIEVVHGNGTREEIVDGRYELKDAAGRTIVERRATTADIARLRAFIR